MTSELMFMEASAAVAAAAARPAWLGSPVARRRRSSRTTKLEVLDGLEGHCRQRGASGRWRSVAVMGHRDSRRFARADRDDRGKSAGPGDHGNRLPAAGGLEAGSGPDGRGRQRRPRLRPGGIIAAAARAGHPY
jgi:hypothetical protein